MTAEIWDRKHCSPQLGIVRSHTSCKFPFHRGHLSSGLGNIKMTYSPFTGVLLFLLCCSLEIWKQVLLYNVVPFRQWFAHFVPFFKALESRNVPGHCHLGLWWGALFWCWVDEVDTSCWTQQSPLVTLSPHDGFLNLGFNERNTFAVDITLHSLFAAGLLQLL